MPEECAEVGSARPATLQPKLPPSSELATRARAINSTAGPIATSADSTTAAAPGAASGGSSRVGAAGGGGSRVTVLPSGALDESEREAFERDGFVILRGVVAPAECRRFLWQVPLARVHDRANNGHARRAFACPGN